MAFPPAFARFRTNVLLPHGSWAIPLTMLMIVSLALHLSLLEALNIVEDESAYLQDAAQIRHDVLPFREYGATKGPVFLFLLHVWERMTGHTIAAGRIFPSLAHVISLPFFFLFARNLLRSQRLAFLASLLWGVSPVIVSLTTNVMHMPLELLWILGALALLSSFAPYRRGTIPLAGFLFFLALLTRVTAGMLLPVLLLVLFARTRSFRPLVWFCGTTALFLVLTAAMSYPLYGWPKIAFLFHADALLVMNEQRAAYASERPPGVRGAFQVLFTSALPLWREGLPLILSTLLLPFFAVRRVPRLVLLAGFFLLFGLLIRFVAADVLTFWREDMFLAQRVASRIVLAGFTFLGGMVIIQKQRTPRLSPLLVGVLLLWIGGLFLVYRQWGRTPPPHYVLEFTPALALAAAPALAHIFRTVERFDQTAKQIGRGVLLLLIVVGLVAPFQAMPKKHYRGTTPVAAAKEMGRLVQQYVPKDEALFTAQPIFPYLGERPLYGYYTHPGWYLAERAGFLPPTIRRLYFPDLPDLASRVERDVHWIIVDWRTADVYFNERAEDTRPFREFLARDFEPVVTVPNPAARDITLYTRRERGAEHKRAQ